MQSSRDDSFASDVIDVENVIVCLLRCQRGRLFLFGQKRFCRFVVSSQSCDRNELSFGITKRGELAAEDAARVDANRSVQPIGLWYGCVTIDHHRLAAVFGGPVVADRQAKLIGLARRLAEQGEVANFAGTAAL